MAGWLDLLSGMHKTYSGVPRRPKCSNGATLTIGFVLKPVGELASDAWWPLDNRVWHAAFRYRRITNASIEPLYFGMQKSWPIDSRELLHAYFGVVVTAAIILRLRMNRLASDLFRDDPKLQKCLVDDAAHVKKGAQGNHVRRIQYAIMILTGGVITGPELCKSSYGPETAKLVKAYKTKRRIINYSYQTAPDDIVGKMTIAALDAEMCAFETKERMSVAMPNSILRFA